MSEAERCPQCGGRLTAGSAEGLCPRCLLAAALRQPAEPAPENLPEPGCQIGSYRIVRLLGEGGMGVVYKALDTRLGRSVALKFIKSQFSERFEREARAIAALNHPHIATLYEVGEHEGAPYLAMECVEGRPLKGPRPVKEVIEYGIQIADALAAAHAAGIVHRDLKPANILVTEKGSVKILDFGLAKLRAQAGDATPATATLTAAIAGTPGYMSPEQIDGKPADSRSDIFAFGCVLYELASGRHAFEGDSVGRVLGATATTEPKPLDGVPAELGKLIQRCLRKDPEHRLQHIGDARIALEELREDSGSGNLAAEMPSRPRRRVWAAGIAALLIAVAAAWLYFREPVQDLEPKTTVFASNAGMQFAGSFSPDGNRVAFAWNGDKQDNYDIYVKVIGTENPLPLTTHPATDAYPAWAPDDRSIAFLRLTSEQTAAIYTVAPLGGSERKIADVVVSRFWYLGGGLCWSRDSKWILSSDADSPGKPPYIVLVSKETGEKRKLTPGEGLGEFNPALSPDNRTLAFSRKVADTQSLLFLLSLDAELQPKPKTPARPLRPPPAGPYNVSPVWTPDGKSLVFTSAGSDWANSARLCRILTPPGSRPALVPQAGQGSAAPAISPQGRRLVFTHYFQDSNIWRIDVPGPGGQAGPLQRVVASTREDQNPIFNPMDGGRIAFESSRSGGYGIWLANADGSNPQLLFADPSYWSGNPAWSPDGRTIAFETTKDKQAEIYRISPEGGASRNLTNHPSDDVTPSWSRDDRWIYFSSKRTGRFEVWRMPATGGEAVQLTSNGGYSARESPDGRTLFFERYRPTSIEDLPSLWTMPATGGEETKVLDSVASRSWSPVEKGLWFVNHTPGVVQFLEFATGQIRKIAPVGQLGATGLAVSPDGRTVLFSRIDSRGSELMLVENFR